MIIDFHTHVFPDLIAEKTVDFLAKQSNCVPSTDGTISNLLSSMDINHINRSIILPVVTKPSQFYSINEFAETLNSYDNITSFAGIHPSSENYIEELNYIKEHGFLGIKLHPDYQHLYIEDSLNVRLIKKAMELDLIIVIHAGVDIGYPSPVHCSPQGSAKMLDLIPNDLLSKAKIIFAHTGGYSQWDDVEKYLVGRPVYFDLSFSMGYISDEQLIRIIRNHGASHILFATDSPWQDQGYCITYLNNLPLTSTEKELIFYQNALQLLTPSF